MQVRKGSPCSGCSFLCGRSGQHLIIPATRRSWPINPSRPAEQTESRGRRRSCRRTFVSSAFILQQDGRKVEPRCFLEHRRVPTIQTSCLEGAAQMWASASVPACVHTCSILSGGGWGGSSGGFYLSSEQRKRKELTADKMAPFSLFHITRAATKKPLESASADSLLL